MLEFLKGLWFYYAGIYQGMPPLDDRNPLEIYLTPRPPQPASPRTRYIYYPGAAEFPSR